MISRKALPLTSAALLILNVLIAPEPASAVGAKSAPPSAQASNKIPVTSFRLPDAVRPVSYKLSFTPDLSAGKFAGDEEIVLTVEKPTAEISLNSLE